MMNSGYYGKVIDNDDPKGIGRIKVRVNGFYDDIQDDIIPYAIPKNVSFNRLDPPPIGSEVQIEFIEGEIMCPVWYVFNGKKAEDMGIKQDQYTKSAVLLYKNLEDYENSGIVKVLFTEKDGLVLEYEKDDNISQINLRKDNTVYFKNSNFDKVVHISNESISLGTEDRSAEPAVLGDKNNEALDHTNDTIKEFATILESNLKTLFTVCNASAILRPLVPSIKLMETQLKAQIITAAFERNEKFYPTTKSEIVSLD